MKITFIPKATLNNVAGRLDSTFWYGDECNWGRTYAIVVNNIVVGLIDIEIDKYGNRRRYGTINMIEIANQYRGRGIGSEVVKALFIELRLQTLFGEALNSAISFWYNMGADFEMSESKLNRYKLMGYSACFKLTKNKAMV